MKFIADEGVDKPIVDTLRNAGFEVDYILESNPGAADDVILALANTQRTVLITQDKDFGELVYRLKQAHYGVVLIRLPGHAPDVKAKIILPLLLEHQGKLLNAFSVIQPNAIRIRN